MIFVLLACVFSCAFPLDIPMDEVDDDDDEASSNKARDVRKLTREKRRGIEYMPLRHPEKNVQLFPSLQLTEDLLKNRSKFN
jgi:hypothetical protein